MITFARLNAILTGFPSTISGTLVISVWMNLPATLRFSFVVEMVFGGPNWESITDADGTLEINKRGWRPNKIRILTISWMGRGSNGWARLSQGILLTYRYQSVPRIHRHPHVWSPSPAGGVTSSCGAEMSKVKGLGESIIREVGIGTHHSGT